MRNVQHAELQAHDKALFDKAREIEVKLTGETGTGVIKCCCVRSSKKALVIFMTSTTIFFYRLYSQIVYGSRHICRAR